MSYRGKFKGLTCQETCVKYLDENPGWHPKINIQLYGIENWPWLPGTVERKLRLAAEGEQEGTNEITAGEYDSKYVKGLVRYCSKGSKPKIEKTRVVIRDGKAYQETYYE